MICRRSLLDSLALRELAAAQLELHDAGYNRCCATPANAGAERDALAFAQSDGFDSSWC